MTLTRHLLAPFALTAAAVLAAPAWATASKPAPATLAFDFYKEGGPLLDQVSVAPHLAVGGVDLVLTALIDGKPADVALRWDGVGVTEGWLNPGAITRNESLVLTFSQPMRVASLALSWFTDGIDRATLSWAQQSVVLTRDRGLGIVGAFDLGGITGQVFTLTGTSLLSAFRLAEVNVTPAAVPEPGSYALMGLGLVGIGLLRSRRQGAV